MFGILLVGKQSGDKAVGIGLRRPEIVVGSAPDALLPAESVGLVGASGQIRHVFLRRLVGNLQFRVELLELVAECRHTHGTAQHY